MALHNKEINPFNLIIAGSRSITEDTILQNVLAQSELYNKYKENLVIIEGEAPGVDTLAKNFALKNNIPFRGFPAKWRDLEAQPCVIKSNKYGSYNALAGLNRNTEMGLIGDGLIAVHDSRSNGTIDMIKQIIGLGKPYEYYVVIDNKVVRVNFKY